VRDEKAAETRPFFVIYAALKHDILFIKFETRIGDV